MRKVPVLMLVFNRPEVTGQVFEAVRKYQPEQLFIAADGPRSSVPSDAVNCALVREIVDSIDWACELKTLFRNENLGCKHGPSSGIDWFFSQVEEGIILEDDCVPSPDFFRFCETMLERYRGNESVMSIAGTSHYHRPDSFAYGFSRFPVTWGWASWRRAWKHFDLEMKDFPKFRKENRIRDIFPGHPYMQWRFLRVFLKVFQAAQYFDDVWDWMWFYAIVSRKGICINPSANLICNVGGSNCHADSGGLCFRKTESLPEQLTEPDEMKFDDAMDTVLFHKVYQGDWKDFVRFFLSRVTPYDWM